MARGTSESPEGRFSFVADSRQVVNCPPPNRMPIGGAILLVRKLCESVTHSPDKNLCVDFMKQALQALNISEVASLQSA